MALSMMASAASGLFERSICSRPSARAITLWFSIVKELPLRSICSVSDSLVKVVAPPTASVDLSWSSEVVVLAWVSLPTLGAGRIETLGDDALAVAILLL